MKNRLVQGKQRRPDLAGYSEQKKQSVNKTKKYHN